MISEIKGRVKRKKDSSVIVDLGGISYEILIPPAVMKNLDAAKSDDGTLELKIYHYFQMDQSKGIPVLVGFLNDVEKDFFERFTPSTPQARHTAALACPMSIAVVGCL